MEELVKKLEEEKKEAEVEKEAERKKLAEVEAKLAEVVERMQLAEEALRARGGWVRVPARPFED
jgi:hypothetical protein